LSPEFVQVRERKCAALARAEELMRSGGVAAVEAVKVVDADFAKWLVRANEI
jgi:hypothetical protein